jgi:F420-non-reducing hydrogenase large subunit
MRVIKISPITRLEGHGNIDIFVDDNGEVEKAFFQAPEFRGFEKFCIGRPAEEMPRITSKICGVCPTAHHMAAAKTLDDLYGVRPTPTAEAIRRTMYNCFIFEDHLLHFYFLGGPDFIMGPESDPAARNILGVVGKVGVETGQKVIRIRKRVRDVISMIAGRVTDPVNCLPGGVSKGLTEENRQEIRETAAEAYELVQLTLGLFQQTVLENPEYVELISGDLYNHETYYMGLVNDQNQVDFYDGQLRVVDPDGAEYANFPVASYLDYISEHVEKWSYLKFPFLKDVGFKGFVDGKDSGVFRVGPLGRLNAAVGMSTPEAQVEHERMYSSLGAKPLHRTLAFHWARLIETLNSVENLIALAEAPELTGKNIREIPTSTPKEGVGVVEAPRGTLIHHYQTDDNGIIENANLVVATVNNAAAINMSIEKVARGLIKDGQATEGLLNMVEIAFRAYDPCLACATHPIGGKMNLVVSIRDRKGEVLQEITDY